MITTRLWVPAALLTALAAGCAGNGAVRQRASSDLVCEANRIRVSATGAGGFRAVGCGRARSYTCRGGVCVGDSDVMEVGSSLSVEPSSGSVASRIVRTSYERMRACLEDPSLTLALDVSIDGEGTIRPLEIHQRVGPNEASCISRVAREASDPRWTNAGELTLYYPPALEALAIEASAMGEVEATTAEPTASAAPSASGSTTAEPAPTPEAESASPEPPGLRARIEARRAAVLACTSSALAAIRADWSADGTFSVALQGHEGSVEGACVRALFEGQRLEVAPAGAGTLLHIIE